MSYYVFVCPKCQSQAQLWQPGSKTAACQKCNAKLQTDSLRVFGPFETHAEAVEKRSSLQAELSQTPGSFSESALAVPVDKEVLMNPPKVKKPQQIILDILKENGTMIVADCEFYCAERGVDGDTFHKILEKLIAAGEIYRPDKGLIALV
ncbi:hypothetical protein MmiAt1_14300 [Methanimicrococcus sp. At1]|uniref:DUF5817 domain-containing protein n=1 Tax=Methanimicrococcus hacksteinii TaxID=3028293 RepID=A0ABU3VR06_9EURY|nr:hypothetical protein [Methanimicrococcus sp. At1]MDV0445831.1 hypothetical protein [Methanimicrococcus sp. At1]